MTMTINVGLTRKIGTPNYGALHEPVLLATPRRSRKLSDSAFSSERHVSSRRSFRNALSSRRDRVATSSVAAVPPWAKFERADRRESPHLPMHPRGSGGARQKPQRHPADIRATMRIISSFVRVRRASHQAQILGRATGNDMVIRLADAHAMTNRPGGGV